MAIFHKYLAIFVVSLQERFVYRANFFMMTFVRFIPIVTTIYLWRAVYAASEEDEIGTLEYPEMIGYYLLVMVSRAFSSMPQLSWTIAQDIREGELNKYLIRPVSYMGFMLTTRISHKLVYWIMAAVPYAIVFYLLRDFLHAPIGLWTWAAYLCSLVLSMLIGFLIATAVGLIGFWYLEISSLLFVVMSLEYFLSGHMVPLTVLPEGMTRILLYLPFQYEAYFPAMLLMGRIPADRLAAEMCLQVGWVVVLLLICRILWKAGLKRYGAYGG